MLTKAQLKKIEEIIKKHYLALTFEALGERALTEEEIELLQKHKLLRTGVRHFTGDAYTLGRIVSSLDKAKAKPITYEAMKEAAKKIPRTTVEKKSIEHSSAHAGEYIKGIGADTAKDFRTSVARAAQEQVRREVSTAVADRLTISQLKSNLMASIQTRKRDWLKVASTEMQDAIQNGVHDEIKRTSPEGDDALVYKRPSPNACKHCKKLYLKSDGVTPKVFRLSALYPTNIGLKSNDWQPTIGPVHPFCQCQLSPVPKGWGFKKKTVAAESFGRYKAGQVIDDITTLTPDERLKTRQEAVLAFTGEDMEEDMDKSLPFSEEDDVCECDY
jgi:hypothetical protein